MMQSSKNGVIHKSVQFEPEIFLKVAELSSLHQQSFHEVVNRCLQEIIEEMENDPSYCTQNHVLEGNSFISYTSKK